MSKPYFPKIYPDIRPFGASGTVLASDPSQPNLLNWIIPTGIGVTGFHQLVDVNLPALASGDYIRYDGNNWFNVTGVASHTVYGGDFGNFTDYIVKSPAASSRNVIEPIHFNATALTLQPGPMTSATNLFLIKGSGYNALRVKLLSNNRYDNITSVLGSGFEVWGNYISLAGSGNGDRLVNIALSADTPIENSGWFYLPSGVGPSGYALISDGLNNNDWGPVASTLTGLSDTNVGSATSGDFIKYDGTGWLNEVLDFSDINSGINTNDLVVSGTLGPSGNGVVNANRFNSAAIIAPQDGGFGVDGSVWSSGAVLFKSATGIGVADRYLHIDYERGHVGIGSGTWAFGSGNAPRGLLTVGEGNAAVPPLKFTDATSLIASPSVNDVGSVEFVGTSGISYIDNMGNRKYLLDETDSLDDISGILDVSKGGTSVTGFNEGGFVFASGNELHNITGFLTETIPIQTLDYPRFLTAASSGYVISPNGSSFESVAPNTLSGVFSLLPDSYSRNHIESSHPETSAFYFVRATGTQNTTLLNFEQQTGENLLQMFYFYAPNTVRLNMFSDVSGSIVRMYGGTDVEFYNSSNQEPIILRHNSLTPSSASGSIVQLPTGAGQLALLSDIEATVGSLTGVDLTSAATGDLLKFNGDNWVNISGIDHGDLLKLGADDHPHYIHVTGTTTRNTIETVGSSAVGLSIHLNSGIVVQSQVPLRLLDPEDNAIFTVRNIYDPSSTGSIFTTVDIGDNATTNSTTALGQLRLRKASYPKFYNFDNSATLSLRLPEETDDEVTVYLPSGDGHLRTIENTSIGDLNNVSSTAQSATSGFILQSDGTGWIAVTGDFGGGGSSDHGALTGLSDDDHTQYIYTSPTTSDRNVIQSQTGIVPLEIQMPTGAIDTQRLALINYDDGNAALDFRVSTSDTSILQLGSGSVSAGQACTVDLYGEMNFYGYIAPALKTTIRGSTFQANDATYLFNNFGGSQSFVSTACTSNQASGFVFRDTSMPASGKVFSSDGNGIYAIDLPTSSSVTGINDLLDVNTTAEVSGSVLMSDGTGWLAVTGSLGSDIKVAYGWSAGLHQLVPNGGVITQVSGSFDKLGGIEYDPQGWVDNEGGVLTILPTVSGLYKCGINLTMNSFDDEAITYVYKNGGLYARLDMIDNTNSKPSVLNGETVVALNGDDDTIDFRIEQDDGAARNISGNGSAVFFCFLMEDFSDDGAIGSAVNVSAGGGGGGGAPTDVSYLTLATDGDLSNERVLVAGTGLIGVDAGANGNYTLNMEADLDDIKDVTITSAASGDVAIYDGSQWINSVGSYSVLELFNSIGGTVISNAAWVDVPYTSEEVNYQTTETFAWSSGSAVIGITRPGVYKFTATATSDNDVNTTRAVSKLRFFDQPPGSGSYNDYVRRTAYTYNRTTNEGEGSMTLQNILVVSASGHLVKYGVRRHAGSTIYGLRDSEDSMRVICERIDENRS